MYKHIICTSLTLATNETLQVVKDYTDEFLQGMSATAIALQLQARELIPESVQYGIQHSKCKKDANAHLLKFLKEGASEEQVLGTFKVAFEETACGRMSQFAAKILQQLQPGQFVA